MLASLQPAEHVRSITDHQCKSTSLSPNLRLAPLSRKPRHSRLISAVHRNSAGCRNSGDVCPRCRADAPPVLGVLVASLVSASTFISLPALAKSQPVQKADPYEDLQKIVTSRGGSNPGSLFENFKKSAAEAAKAPVEALKAPAEVFKAPEPASPSPLLPITKADPIPAKAQTQPASSGSGGLLAAVGALVVAAGLALNARGGSKASAPSPNKLQAKVKRGAKAASKQAPQQSSSPLSFLSNKASGTGQVKAGQVGKTAKIKAGQVGKTAKIKAGQVGKTAKIKAGATPKKGGLFGTGSTKPKEVAAKASGGLFGTGSTRPKQAAAKASGGLFGTGSTRPGTGSTRSGTGSTRPGTKSLRPGGTGKVKAPTPGRAASAAQRAASTGGSNLLNEDAGTTVGALGVVGLAVAVGGLVIFSLGGSGGGGGSQAETSAKSLLDRVPEPLPVARKAQQATTEVTNKRTPLAPPLTDFNKPKAPSGPDLKPPSPGGLANSLGATPQLAKSAPEAAGKAASKAKSKASQATSQIAQAPAKPKTPSSRTNFVLLGLASTIVACVVIANKADDTGPPLSVALKEAQKEAKKDPPSPAEVSKAQSGSSGTGPSPPDNPAPTNGSNGSNGSNGTPKTAEEAAADAKERAGEAKKWIEEWKSNQ